jgi:hypothetical protein
VLAAGLALAVATPARAQEEGGFQGFMIEAAVGLATPLSEAQWEDTADPSFITGVAFGYMFSLGGWSAAIGPEVDLSYSPTNVEDKEWGEGGTHGGQHDVRVGRLRFTGGARFVVGFGSAYLLGRVGVGMDYAYANWDDPPVHDNDGDTADADVGASLLLAAGMGYMLADWVGLTVQMEFPIGFHDNPNTLPVELDGDMLDLVATAAATFLL